MKEKEHTIKNRIKDFPITFYSMVMAFTGCSIGVQKAIMIFSFPNIIAFIALTISTALFIFITAIYLKKILQHPDSVRKEFNSPIKINFFPTFSISLLLLSIGFLPVIVVVSKYLWIIGTFFHFIFTLVIINTWMHQDKFKITHMNPSWFIPAVGNILIPIAGVAHAPSDISWFFFSCGLFFWVILMVIVFYRVIFHEPIAEKLLPTLFILIAPPAIGFISYYKLSGDVGGFGKSLYFFSLFLTILLFSQLRIFRRIKFFLSYWAYVFPLAAMSIANATMYHVTNVETYKYLHLAFLIVVLLLTCIFSYKTCVAIYRKEICVEDIATEGIVT
jgi:tellurite resistance protein